MRTLERNNKKHRPAPNTRAAWHRAVYRAWLAIDQAEQALRAPWCAGLARHNWQAALRRAQSARTAAIDEGATL